jgi:hypothetical protein
MKPTLNAPGSKRLKPQHDKLLSSFAFIFNLCRYTTEIKEWRAHAEQMADDLASARAEAGLHASCSPRHFISFQPLLHEINAAV